MAYSEEKMLILKMLEEGKINSQEAAKLIEAIEGNSKQGGGDTSYKQQKAQPNFHEEVQKLREKINDWTKEVKNSYNQKDFDRMVDEFSAKAEKVGKNLAATTVDMVDKIADFVGSFVDTNAFNIFGSYPIVERTFETPATEGMELEVEGVNGQILVKKHMDNKVVIISRVRSAANNADEILKFGAEGNKVSLKLNKYGNISVSQEIYLPAVKFDKIRFETSNGRIYVEDSIAGDFEAATRNGGVDLMGVNGDKISITTKNAKVQLGYVIGKEIAINTNNSLIDIKNIKTEDLKAVTANGRILVENAQSYKDTPDINMQLKTSNGGIKVNMNDLSSKGYKVKAQTTNGGVNLLIPEIVYSNVNKQMTGSLVEAESKDYGSNPEKVSISAETVNGYIEIVK